MRESVFAASGFSLVSLWFQAEKGALSHLVCLSFANTIQANLPTCEPNWYQNIFTTGSFIRENDATLMGLLLLVY